ncbi:MAG TPA: DNA methyltransferase [Thermomicrobiales bacterium]|nr:DNA methyltransferase [Thermomicrobiales bacterium]
MNIHDFQAKWRGSTLKERSAAQEHFIDLCRVLGMPTPVEADKTGSFYTFEKGAAKSAGGQGFADVWWRGRFGWEYKGPRADLNGAYQQLLQYRKDLDNPPLLVVCDLHRFEVDTNFTGTGKFIYAFTVDDLSEPVPILPSSLSAREILRAVFDDPERLRPEATVERITKDAAGYFGSIALSLAERGVEPHPAAHYLMQLLFCMFSEDVGLLPKGLFSQLVTFGATYPERFTREVGALLLAMRDGGFYNLQPIERFNGGLFAEIHVEPLTAGDLERLSQASRLDWSSVEPAIFGTLFERSLDPAKRSQLGAHYTGRSDIKRVVEPVVMQPLRRRWEVVRAEADALKAAWDAAETPAERNRRRQAFANRLFAFQEELAALRIMDVACGSGNFLYVALAALMDLEKEVGLYGAANGLPMMFPRVSPAQLYGLEINQYAQELTQVVVWIGYLQWMTTNGFQPSRDPVLQPLNTIRLRDALLDLSDPDYPKEAEWPRADFIIGNPPFLGGKRLRSELGDAYVDDLFAVYHGRVAREADLVCYFFEKARAKIERGTVNRTGLLATNSIRGGANRRVLERVKQSGDIFAAWSDEPWILDGAAVRISIVGFDDGSDARRRLNGHEVAAINADLTGLTDITSAHRLPENVGVAFMGTTKGGAFDIPGDFARFWLALPVNTNGRPSSDVVRPWSPAWTLHVVHATCGSLTLALICQWTMQPCMKPRSSMSGVTYGPFANRPIALCIENVGGCIWRRGPECGRRFTDYSASSVRTD